MPPTTTSDKSSSPVLYRPIHSAVHGPATQLPEEGNPSALYVAEDGTDIQFWDHRNQRYRSTQQKREGHFLLSSRKTEGAFIYNGKFTDPVVPNLIQNRTDNIELKGSFTETRLQDFLRLYHSFDEDFSTGNSLIDNIGGYNVPSQNIVGFQQVSGKFTSNNNNKAIQLEGSNANHLITFEKGPAFHVGGSDDSTGDYSFTIAFWLQLNLSFSTGVTVLHSSNGGDRYFSVLILSTGHIEFRADNGSGTEASFSSHQKIYSDNRWHHIAITRNVKSDPNKNNAISLFLNGELDSSLQHAKFSGTISGAYVNELGDSRNTSPGGAYTIDALGVWETELQLPALQKLIGSPESHYYLNYVSIANNYNKIAYYSFEEENITDYYGNYHGTKNGSVNVSADPMHFGHALDVPSGPGHYVNIGEAIRALGTSDFCIAFWLKPRKETTGAIFGHGNPGAPSTMQCAITSAQGPDLSLSVTIWTNSSTTGNPTQKGKAKKIISAHQWNHIVIQRSAGTVTLYVNDISTESFVDGGTNFQASLPSAYGYIGAAKHTGAGFKGALKSYLNEFAIWSQSIAESEISAIFNEAFPGYDGFLDRMNLTNLLNSHYAFDKSLSDSVNTHNGKEFSSYYVGARDQPGTGAVVFPSDTESINVGSAFQLEPLAFTVSLWIAFGSVSSTQTIVDAYDSNVPNDQGFRITYNASADVLEFHTANGQGNKNTFSSTPLGISAKEWYFVAVVRQNTHASLYVYDNDGSEIVADTTSTDIVEGSLSVSDSIDTFLGSNTSASLASGTLLSNVDVYKRSIAENQVKTLLNDGEGRTLDDYKHWDYLRNASGMRVNAFGQSNQAYLEFEGDMSGYTNFTVSTWVKPLLFFEGKDRPAYIVWVGDGGKQNSGIVEKNAYVAYDHNQGTLKINGNDQSHKVHRTLSTNTWYHVALVRKGNKSLQLYIDGVHMLTSRSVEGSNAGDTLRIGGAFVDTSGTIYGTMDALIDQTTVFKEALTRPSIHTLYNKGLGIDIQTDIPRFDQNTGDGGNGNGNGDGTKVQYARDPAHLFRYLHAYYSFENSNTPKTRTAANDQRLSWLRDDVGVYDAIVDPPANASSASFSVSNTESKLGSYGLQSPGDASETQHFQVGGGDTVGNGLPFTISFWFKPLNISVNHQTLYLSDYSDANNSLSLVQNGATLLLRTQGETKLSSSSDFTPSEWTHVVVRYDNKSSPPTLALYMNGNLDQSLSTNKLGSLVGGNGAFVDDTSGSAYYVDEIGFFTGLLGTEDIGYIYNEGKGNNDFVFRLWHNFAAQKNVPFKYNRLNSLGEPLASTDGATKGYADAGNQLYENFRSYYTFADHHDKISAHDFSLAGDTRLASSSSNLPSGDALEFIGTNGSGDYVNVGDAFHFAGNTPTDVTFSFWIYLQDTVNKQTLLSSNDDNISGIRNEYTDIVYDPTGSVSVIAVDFFDGNSTYAVITENSSDIANANAWHHIVVTCVWSSSSTELTAYVYVDGLLQGQATLNPSGPLTTDPSRPGSSLQPYQSAAPSTISSSTSSVRANSGNGTPAYIDEVGVWTRSFSYADVHYLYNNGTPWNHFLRRRWNEVAAHGNVDANYNRITNLPPPVHKNDAVRYSDLSTSRQSNVEVRHTVNTSHVGAQGRAALLGQTASSATVSTAYHANGLAKELRTHIDWLDYTSGNMRTLDLHDETEITVTNGSTMDNTSEADKRSITLKPGAMVDMGDRLEFGADEFTIAFPIEIMTTPGSIQEIVTDDKNHIGGNFSGAGMIISYTASDEISVTVQREDNTQLNLSFDYTSAKDTTSNQVIALTRTNKGGDAVFTLFYGGKKMVSDSLVGGDDAVITSQGANAGRLYAHDVDVTYGAVSVWDISLPQRSLRALLAYPFEVHLFNTVDYNNSLANQVKNHADPVYIDPTGNGGGPQYINSSVYKDTAEAYIEYAIDGSGIFPPETSATTLLFCLQVGTVTANRVILQSVDAQGTPTDLCLYQRGKNIELVNKSNSHSTIRTTDGPLEANEFIHIGIRMEKGVVNANMDLFVNGQFVGTTEKPPYGVSGNGDSVRLMEEMTASNNELLNRVHIWDYPLPDWEIYMVYNVGDVLTSDQLLSDQQARHMSPVYPLTFTSDSSTHHFSFGSGFQEGAQCNIGVATSEFLGWSLSSSSSLTHYLYVSYDDTNEVLTTGSTTAPPRYSFKRPRATDVPPGTYWYPLDHRQHGEYLDSNKKWKKQLRLYVGEVKTAKKDNNSNTFEVTEDQIWSFAYQGRYLSNTVEGQDKDTHFLFDHNIGTNVVRNKVIAEYKADSEGYEAGDQIVLGSTQNASHAVYNKKNGRQTGLSLQQEGLANFTKAHGNKTSIDPNWSEFVLSMQVQRAF